MKAPLLCRFVWLSATLLAASRADDFITITKERIEGSESSGHLKVSFLRTGGTASPLSATAHVTNFDGTTQDLPVNFPAGSSSTVDVNIPVLTDTIFTGTLTYTVDLVPPNGSVTVAPIARATLVRLDDEQLTDFGSVFSGVYFDGGSYASGTVGIAVSKAGLATFSLQSAFGPRWVSKFQLGSQTGISLFNSTLGFISLHLQRFESPMPYEVIGRANGPDGRVVLRAGRVARASRGIPLDGLLPSDRVFSGVLTNDFLAKTLYAPTSAKLGAKGRWSFRGRSIDGRPAVHHSRALTDGRVVFAQKPLGHRVGARLGILKINPTTHTLDGVLDTASSEVLGPYTLPYVTTETAVLGAYPAPFSGQYPGAFGANGGASKLTLRDPVGADASQQFTWTPGRISAVATGPVTMPLTFVFNRLSGLATGIVRVSGAASPLPFTAAFVNAPGDPLDGQFVGVAGMGATVRPVLVAPATP